MMRLFMIVLWSLMAVPALADKAQNSKTAYDFTLPALDGGALALADYAGQPILLVNTASQCGFTGQYEGLQALWSHYRDKGLVVLGVPSNDFGGQEPGKADDIKAFCEVNFNIDFPMSDKLVVRGDQAHPLYQWLRAELGDKARPKWNFYKYLIDADGRAVSYYSSMTKPDSRKLRRAIEDVLAAAQPSPN
jgi:glutathione peroxidase